MAWDEPAVDDGIGSYMDGNSLSVSVGCASSVFVGVFCGSLLTNGTHDV